MFSAKGAALTNRGRVRRLNEDGFVFGGILAWSDLTQPLTAECSATSPWIIAVADGIGGQSAGEQASREVIFALAKCPKKSSNGVIDTLQTVDRNLVERARLEPTLAGMGATVAGLGCEGDEFFAFNVGDSRVYRLHDGFLAQLTSDDTVAQAYVDAGHLDPEAVRPANAHQITQAIGSATEAVGLDAHVTQVKLAGATRFLLCTDGLSDMVALEEMEQIFSRHGEAAVVVMELYEAAMRAGGEDNATIVVADVNPGGGAEMGER